ncbi:MAG TPA: dienelactone hydrolase family protein [Mycobacteriales bacterium]|nr:dienelactone hydrolase family protein [Mycobacteriales bacterium]
MVATREFVLEHGSARVPTLLYLPNADGPRPAVVLAPEAFGINTFTRHVASELAAAGYVTVVPDYYRGHGLSNPESYTDFEEVTRFIDALDFTEATHDVLAAVDHARDLPEVDAARVAVWGYCTGGTLAMLAASLDRRLAAGVLFFPSQPTFPELTPKRPVQPVDLLWNVACPLLVIYGDQDPVVTPEVVADMRNRLDQWKIQHEFAMYPDAGHAFSAPVGPMRNADADAASWADAIRFLRTHLALGESQPGTR